MKRIIVAKKLPSFAKDVVDENFEVIFIGDINEETYPNFIKALPHADGLLITADFDYFKEVHQLANNLKGVSTIAVGHDNIPVSKLAESNVKCTHTPDILSEATADLIFGLLLAIARRIPELDVFVKAGKWQKSIGEGLFGTNVYGKN